MHKVFSAKIEELHAMIDLIVRVASRGGFPEVEIRKIQLASEEALVNIIHYAYPEEKGELELTCSFVAQGQIEIVLKDKGVPFNPLRDCADVDTEASIDDRMIGGLGVMMVKKFMDQVSYKRDGDKNILVMRKTIS